MQGTYEEPPVAREEGMPSSEWHLDINISIAHCSVGLASIPGFISEYISCFGSIGNNRDAIRAQQVLVADVAVDDAP